MHWLVGLDEAGYGPNLGPLVQAAVAARVPDGCECLWTHYSAGVCRAGEPPNGRLVIDDSKIVYSSRGLAGLETGVLVALSQPVGDSFPFGTFVNGVTAGRSRPLVEIEPWYDPADPYPFVCPRDEFTSGAIADFWADGPDIDICYAHVTPTPVFNELVDRHGSKAAPLSEGVITLLRDMMASLPGGEAIRFVVDKQGGRNFYAPIIQTAIPDGWVVVECEGAAESAYHIEGLGREVRLTFKPRAERDCLPVALASMLAKYLREAFMRQFNRYWLKHVPGVKPTAGYPGDAKRFYDEIRGAMAALGLRDDDVWRKR